ncbi:MAG: hypothetical protein ACXWE9_07890 [Methylobacter sp.]
MAGATLFLASESGHTETVHRDVAIVTAKQLIKTLRHAKRTNAKISLNTNVRLADCQVTPTQTLSLLLAGKPEYKEEWLFLKELATKSPLSSGLEAWLVEADWLETKLSNGNKPSDALKWAHLLSTGTVSFYVQPEWKNPWIEANCFSLSEAGIETCFEKKVRNISALDHLQEHQDWLKALGIEPVATAKQLWEERESRFQGLRFLGRTQEDIENLEKSGAPFKQALNALALLSDDALRWNGQGLPGFSIKVADGEHDKRRSLSQFIDEFTNNEEEFGRHGYFTGGVAGRIHFRLSPNEKKFVVAYIGLKL